VRHDQDAAVAAATVANDARSALLADLLGRVAGCIPRRETRQSCGQMVSGLLMELDDHNCWTIAEAAAFVAADEGYGGRELRRGIRQRGMGYVMAVRANHFVTTGSGRAVTAAAAVLLAYLYLAVAVAVAVAVAAQRQQDTGSDRDVGLIPVTVPELLRLLRDIVIPVGADYSSVLVRQRACTRGGCRRAGPGCGYRDARSARDQ
jgi:hypothetical protein